MAARGSRKDLVQIADHVVERMEALIAIMQDAADQVSCGTPLENVPVGSYQLYLAKKEFDDDESEPAESIVYAVDYEDFIRILENTAEAQGVCLDELSELEVVLPESEFGEDLVTGGFGNFKGVSVQVRNDCGRFEARGLAVACVAEEDVVFCLPLRERI
jgi:hypothetical protein